MRWKNRYGLLLAAALALGSGCAVSPEAAQQIRDHAAAAAADDRDKEKLTPGQLKVAVHDSAKAWSTLNFAINGVPIPADYADVTSSAK